MKWVCRQVSETAVKALQEALSISETLACLLVENSITDPEEAASFLNPRLAYLKDPLIIHGLSEVVDRLFQAREKKEKVVVLGDYDVDGLTSVALMTLILRQLDIDVTYFVPNRFDDGYGLSRSVVEKILKEMVPNVFIALDCGTNSLSEIELLQRHNVDVIVVDHHSNSCGELPKCLIVNPHAYPDIDTADARRLCSVGLVFKLAHGILKKLKTINPELAYRIKLREYLDLVAMGTVADLVPLQGDNRILTKFGLELLPESHLPGVKALIKVAGLQDGQKLIPGDISFKLAPRINVSGRISDAHLPLKMLLSEQFSEAFGWAKELDILNKKRQFIEQQIVEEALGMIDLKDIPAGVVLYSEKWHSGVVGIVAGKLAKQFNRPVVILGREGHVVKGSARGTGLFNLVGILTKCKDLLETWGGHPQAVGVSLLPENLEAFRAQFSLAVTKQGGTSEHTDIELPISRTLSVDDVTMQLFDEMEVMQPFGIGNPQPVFVIEHVILQKPVELFGENREHVRFKLSLPASESTGVVGWRLRDPSLPIHQPVSLAVKLSWNYWNSRRYPQLELLDWAP